MWEPFDNKSRLTSLYKSAKTINKIQLSQEYTTSFIRVQKIPQPY